MIVIVWYSPEQAGKFLLLCFLIIPVKTWKVNEGEAWRRFPGRYFKKQLNRKYVRFFVVRFHSLCYTICMKENLIHYRTCVCNINYHMVWSVKYRRKILSPEVEEYLQELVQQIADDKGFTVHLFECGEGDHVHCFVSAPPKLSITAIVKYLKGITGRKLFERFPEIRNQLWKGELWNYSYYVETVGSVSEENIRRYIEHQSKAY